MMPLFLFELTPLPLLCRSSKGLSVGEFHGVAVRIIEQTLSCISSYDCTDRELVLRLDGLHLLKF